MKPASWSIAGKNRVLVNRPVLDRALFLVPHDALVLFEPTKEEVELHHGTPSVHVRIEIGQVGVVIHGLLVCLVAEVVGKLLGEGGFTRPDDSGDSDEHDYFYLLLDWSRSSLGCSV
jgi:hypothetical protein